ncbi:MAG TPA: ABC transporter permease [Chloroflexota bacterium]|nr:ABC transporter permease [Chloroflexota bacterium]
MGRYLLRRLASMVPVVIIVSFLVFALINVLPGDPALMMLGENNNDPGAYQRLRTELGLDRPLAFQYVDWATHALTGDFGTSLRDRMPIRQAIGARVLPTLELAVLGLALSLLISIPVGIISALKPGSWIDSLATVLALSGVAIPHFFLGILLIELFAVNWHVLPPSGYIAPWTDLGENLRLMLLPALALSTGLTAVQMRHVRSSLLDVLHQEYVLTARAKGLHEQTVVLGHALRNALIPLATIVGLETGSLISGTVILETIFSVPGMGRLLVDSITFRDYPTVQAMVLLLALTVLVANLLADLTYGLLDPRVAYGARAGA